MKRISLKKREETCKTRPVMRLCRWIVDTLRQKGELPSCEKLGQEFEVSHRTVRRDIDLLRDFMGYPIAYSPTEYKWKLTGPMPEPVL